jgi:hypothetical protein
MMHQHHHQQLPQLPVVIQQQPVPHLLHLPVATQPHLLLVVDMRQHQHLPHLVGAVSTQQHLLCTHQHQQLQLH